MKKPGYKLYWDENAKAAYLYNANLNHFVTFDDKRSVAYKRPFVNYKGLAGVMF